MALIPISRNQSQTLFEQVKEINMCKQLLLLVLISLPFYSNGYAQKKYGYAVLYLRCGDSDPSRDRVYFSPVIELNALNFEKYTNGVDPSFPKFSVRYYNYAIAKWFEFYLKKRMGIAVNDAKQYERNASSFVFNSTIRENCNSEKTAQGCFFTNKQQLIQLRNEAIHQARLPEKTNDFCGVIAL